MKCMVDAEKDLQEEVSAINLLLMPRNPGESPRLNLVLINSCNLCTIQLVCTSTLNLYYLNSQAFINT